MTQTANSEFGDAHVRHLVGRIRQRKHGRGDPLRHYFRDVSHSFVIAAAVPIVIEAPFEWLTGIAVPLLAAAMGAAGLTWGTYKATRRAQFHEFRMRLGLEVDGLLGDVEQHATAVSWKRYASQRGIELSLKGAVTRARALHAHPLLEGLERVAEAVSEFDRAIGLPYTTAADWAGEAPTPDEKKANEVRERELITAGMNMRIAITDARNAVSQLLSPN